MKKVGVAAVLAVGTWFGSGALGFPHVFRTMFVVYVVLGLLVFLLLDAPPVPRLSGWSAGVALMGFYLALSVLYVGGASLLPQYDPSVEKGKIEKILKRKRALALALTDGQRTDHLLQRVATLQARSAAIMARMASSTPAASASVAAASGVRGDDRRVAHAGPSSHDPATVVEQGAELYELHECYNCHKIGGKGSVKKRGPVLDNIGNLLTANDIKNKILDPGYLYAEGFEKEHKKGRMPDTYKDLMTDEEVRNLSMYLSTLKDVTVETPRPVFVRADVEHGFTVFGYVRDPLGKGMPGVAVRVTPEVKGGHAAAGTTNDIGYYEIFLHMHNHNAGASVTVSAQNVTRTFVADYDPTDHITRRQRSVDVTVAGRQAS